MITINEICAWAPTTPNNRNFIEGERLLKAGHVIKCGKNGNVSEEKISVTAYCLQTTNLKGNPHQIDGLLSKMGKIDFIVCSCKAGKGERCKHILATLLFCSRYNETELEELSCTDKACVWKNSFKDVLSNYVDYHPLLTHDCFSNKIPTKQFKVCDELRKKIEETALRELPNSAFAKQEKGRHAPIFTSEKKAREIDTAALESIFAYQRSELMDFIAKLATDSIEDCCEDVLINLKGDYVKICMDTLQSYLEWQTERRCRITGAVCYELFTYSSNKKPNWKKKCESFFEVKNFKSKYIEYGKEKEKEAREVFKEATKTKVLETGLIVCKQNPWLAYSPDGIVFNEEKPVALLEIKCPYKGKEMTVSEAMKYEFKKCLSVLNEQFVLKKKHKYYGQVQLGMAVVNVKVACFFIYAAFDKSFYMIKVPFDLDFVTDMLSTLKKTYFNIMLHELCSLIKKSKENNENNNNGLLNSLM